jgi:hypothetical protein
MLKRFYILVRDARQFGSRRGAKSAQGAVRRLEKGVGGFLGFAVQTSTPQPLDHGAGSRKETQAGQSNTRLRKEDERNRRQLDSARVGRDAMRC